jgi:hypothetical protein
MGSPSLADGRDNARRWNRVANSDAFAIEVVNSAGRDHRVAAIAKWSAKVAGNCAREAVRFSSSTWGAQAA